MIIIRNLILTVLASVTLVELACRCIWSEQQTMWSSAYRPPISTQLLNLALIRESPAGRRLAPNLTMSASSPYSKIGTFNFRTNSLGTRGAEPLAEKGLYRVLFLGDSVTWNSYLAEEESFTSMIQNQLNNKVEVVNGAIGATGIDNYLSLLKEIGPKLKSDLVVVGLYLNDSTTSPAFQRLQLPYPLYYSRYLSLLAEQIGRYRYLKSQEYQKIVLDTKDLARGVLDNFYHYDGATESKCTKYLGQAIDSAQLDWGLGWSDHAWDRIGNSLREIKSVTDRSTSKLAVILFPVSFQLCNAANLSFPSVKFKELAQRLNIPALDLLPIFQQYPAADLLIDHCHLTVKGNQIVARELKQFLEAEFLSVL